MPGAVPRSLWGNISGPGDSMDSVGHYLIHPQGSPQGHGCVGSPFPSPALGECGASCPASPSMGTTGTPPRCQVTPQLPVPHGIVMVTSASRSSAEMLTKFRSGDSTGVDCRRKVGKMEGRKKKNLVPVALEKQLHPMGKVSNLHSTNNPQSLPLHQRLWHLQPQARGACHPPPPPLPPPCQGQCRSQTWRTRCRC